MRRVCSTWFIFEHIGLVFMLAIYFIHVSGCLGQGGLEDGGTLS